MSADRIAPVGAGVARGDTSPAISAIQMFVGLIVLPVLIVVLPIDSTSSDRTYIIVILQWGIIGYSGWRLAQIVWLAEPRWVALSFWAFSYVWLGVAGLAQVMYGKNPLLTLIDDDLALRQMLVILLGFIAYDVATYVVRQSPRLRGVAQPGRELAIKRVVSVGAVGVLITPLTISALGGVETLFSNREAINQQLTSTGLYGPSGKAAGGLVLAFGQGLPFVGLVGLVWIFCSNSRARKSVSVWVLLAALVFSNLLINNPISNARYWFFTIVLTFVFSVTRLQGRPGIVGVIIAYVLAATFAFPYLDAFRYDRPVASLGSSPAEFFVRKTDYGAVTDIGLVIRLTDREGFQGGWQMLGVATFWVPRALWSEKPENTGLLIARDTNFPNENLDSPLWAEGFIDFGWLGVALVLGLFGLVSASLDQRYLVARRGGAVVVGGAVPVILIVAPVFAAYEAILIRGSLLQAMSRIVVVIGVLWFMSRRARAPS